MAGLSSAVVLASAGFRVRIFEARPYVGGRAASYKVPGLQPEPVIIDNCQHILLRCCVNLLDFYSRLGVRSKIKFHRRFTFLEPGGRLSRFEAGMLPAPLHFTGSFARLHFLGWRDKIAVARALVALRRERRSRSDLDRITMMDWLHEKRQTPAAIENFWRQILLSAVNEELERMAASHGFQVFWLGFLASRGSYQMGIPSVPLGELYNRISLNQIENVTLRTRLPVKQLLFEEHLVGGVLVNGERQTADYYISAVPFERVPELMPELGLDLAGWEHSPITGIHLWFDRPVTDLPHAALLGRTIQWFYSEQEGRYLKLVVSASRDLTGTPRGKVISLALGQLREFLPGARDAQLVQAHVVKEMRATFPAQPGIDSRRPRAVTRLANLFLAGDWTRTGWPATMEGAVRSGYLAGEAVTQAAGRRIKFLCPDIA